jgi:hypothetical protein
VKTANGCKTARGEHDLAAARYTAADKAGIAALGHNRRTGVRARANNPLDLSSVGGPNDSTRRSAESSCPIALETRTQPGVRQHVVCSDDLRQLLFKLHRCLACYDANDR